MVAKETGDVRKSTCSALRAGRFILAAAGMMLGIAAGGDALAQSESDSPFDGGVFEEGFLDDIFDDEFAVDTESGGGDFNVGGSSGGNISIGGAGGITIGGGSGGSVNAEE